MINSAFPARSVVSQLQQKLSLQDGAGALLSERIDLLAREADEQTVFLLVLGDIFDDLGYCLGDGHSLDRSFAT